MKDFGVTFDPELSFNFHCNEKMNKNSRKKAGSGQLEHICASILN